MHIWPPYLRPTKDECSSHTSLVSVKVSLKNPAGNGTPYGGILFFEK
jgi:hypothetical protein